MPYARRAKSRDLDMARHSSHIETRERGRARYSAAFMKAVAEACQVKTLDLAVRDGPRRWDARDIAQHIDFFKDAVLASRPLAKGSFLVFDPAKHPRWPAGMPEGQGGQFALADGSVQRYRPRRRVTSPSAWNQEASIEALLVLS